MGRTAPVPDATTVESSRTFGPQAVFGVVRTSGGTGATPIEGDGNQLRQVFQNLIENAIEYGGEDPRVTVSADRREDCPDEWAIAVSDDGVGIPPERQEEIFQVFQRLHGREEHAGTGIGLALCRRIVERHGGELWVDSTPGEGSTFFVTRPPADGPRKVGSIGESESPSR